jgi:hypothetical protein
MQLGESSKPGSIISAHPIPTLLEPDLLFLMNSIWMLNERVQVLLWLCLSIPATCISVRKPYRNRPDTLVALTTASEYFPMLPAPPGAVESTLRLWKCILTYSSKLLKWWRCIQSATGLSIRHVKLWSYWDRCTDLQETSRASVTSAQALQETCCHNFTPVVFRVL